MYFKQTFIQFMESKELGVLRPRPLSPVEVSKSKAAVKAIRIIYSFLKKHRAKDEYTVQDVQDLHDDLVALGNKVKFIKDVELEIRNVLTAYEKSTKSGDVIMSNRGALKQHIGNLRSSFMSNNKASMKLHSAKISDFLQKIDHHVDVPGSVHRVVSNHYTAQASIFGSMRLLDTISTDDLAEVAKINFDDTLYTTIDYPHGKEDTFDYVLFFLQHLKTSPKPVRINDTEHFRLHTQVENSSSAKFDELKAVVDKYLHSNDKALIATILKLINGIPSIKKANDTQKRKVKIVYRGLGFSGEVPSIEQILKTEKAHKYVATSTSRHTAKNFALQKGHLETEDSRRSEVGIILVYEVTPDSILFDTKVVDTVYGESEILIDATKAKLIETIDV